MEAPAESERRAWRTAALLFAAALLVRLLPWTTVFTRERIELFGYDAYYHLRRVLYDVVRFPEVLDFDPYLHYPQGARSIWPPFFDALVAWIALPAYSLFGEPGVEAVAALVPPLLGAASVVWLYVLARRLFDPQVAWLAGALLCVLSSHFWYSQVGFLDHHAAVALLSTGLLAGALDWLCRSERGEAAFGPALWTGGLAGGLLLVWPGGLLHVGIAFGGVLVFAALQIGKEQGQRVGLELAAASSVAGALLWLAVGEASPPYGPMSPVVLSFFQPWLFGVGAFCALCLAALANLPGLARSPLRRALGGGLLGVVLIALSALVWPDLRSAFGEAWGWLAKREAFQAQVGESQPLFYGPTGFTRTIAELRLSGFVYIAPFAAAALAFGASRRHGDGEDRAARWLLVGWFAVLFAVTLLQRRFMNSLAAPLALVVAASGVALARALAPSLSPALRRPALLGACLLVAMALWPMQDAYRPALLNNLRVFRGQPATIDRTRAQKLGAIRASEWLRANTPETEGFLDAKARPEYGVLNPWSDGHVVKYFGRRPTLVDNFGDDLGADSFLEGTRYYQALDEEEALEILERFRLRYVLVRPGAGKGRAFSRRLHADDGRGLSHHRLVYETPLEERTAHLPSTKIFERVRGATIHGRAPAGARVQAELDLVTQRGRATSYRVETRADAGGVYRLGVAHASGSLEPLRSEAEYRLRSEGHEGRVGVSEEALREGARVSGPDLRR